MVASPHIDRKQASTKDQREGFIQKKTMRKLPKTKQKLPTTWQKNTVFVFVMPPRPRKGWKCPVRCRLHKQLIQIIPPKGKNVCLVFIVPLTGPCVCICKCFEAKQQVVHFDTADCRSHPGSKVKQRACKYCTLCCCGFSVSQKVRRLRQDVIRSVFDDFV